MKFEDKAITAGLVVFLFCFVAFTLTVCINTLRSEPTRKLQCQCVEASK